MLLCERIAELTDRRQEDLGTIADSYPQTDVLGTIAATFCADLMTLSVQYSPVGDTQRGWGMNRVCDEVVYVVSGSGALETPDSVTPLAPGDVAFVPKGQKIAWRGEQLVIFIPCVPAWSPEQHELFDA